MQAGWNSTREITWPLNQQQLRRSVSSSPSRAAAQFGVDAQAERVSRSGFSAALRGPALWPLQRAGAGLLSCHASSVQCIAGCGKPREAPPTRDPHLALLAMLRPTVHVNKYLGGTLKGSPSACCCCPPPLRPGGGSGGSAAMPACCRPLSDMPGRRPNCCCACCCTCCACCACCCACCCTAACCCCTTAACCAATVAAATVRASGGAGWPSGSAARFGLLEDRLRVRPGVMAVGISSRS